jgi:hypothetical protein
LVWRRFTIIINLADVMFQDGILNEEEGLVGYVEASKRCSGCRAGV